VRPAAQPYAVFEDHLHLASSGATGVEGIMSRVNDGNAQFMPTRPTTGAIRKKTQGI